MGFVTKRRNQDTEEPQKPINNTKPLSPLQESLKVIEDLKIEDDEALKKKFYTEQSKIVLDIMEKQGIDFYDDSRYGGMYLKSKNEQRSKNNLIDRLVNKSNPIDKVEDRSSLIDKLLSKTPNPET